MNKTPLDKTLTAPIADFCAFGEKLVVSSYDSSLRIYSENKCLYSIETSCSFTKLCIYKSKIIAISHSTGTLNVFDSFLKLVDEMEGFYRACVIHPFRDCVLVGTMNQEIFILKENESLDGKFLKQNFRISKMPGVVKIPTAIASSDGLVAISFENVLSVFDKEFNAVFSKELACTITSLAFYSESVVAGLNNGKIQIENINDPNESFLFNSHSLTCADNRKVLYPVTHIEKHTQLITSGYEGKIIKWDIEHKSLISCIFDYKNFIRKFLINNGIIYTLVENSSFCNKAKSTSDDLVSSELGAEINGLSNNLYYLEL